MNIGKFLTQISPLSRWQKILNIFSLPCNIPDDYDNDDNNNNILLSTYYVSETTESNFLESIYVTLTMTLWRDKYYFLLSQWGNWSTDEFNDLLKVISSVWRAGNWTVYAAWLHSPWSIFLERLTYQVPFIMCKSIHHFY